MTYDTDNTEWLSELRWEAAEAGDLAQVELCDLAMEGDLKAMEQCGAAIAQARAMEEID